MASKSFYRAEIDGLRAFAVLSVVLYHAFPQVLTGGFVGVDVFFVISGYLITTHIFESLDQGRFSFLDFFGRRIRRIFPALILVMISSLIFGWFTLISEEFQQLGKHIAGGAAFIVNFILIGESGYFDTVAELKPMLHLWSLAVEEQFYIIWPVVLFVMWRLGFRLIWITLLVALASFYLNVRYIASLPTEIFFWPFSRFWELLSGSILAWLMLYKRDHIEQAKTLFGRAVSFGQTQNHAQLTENVMAISGLFLLLCGFVTITPTMAFPSTWALIPVAGAVLVIAAGATAWSNRIFMMNRIAVWFGLISYPLYLWHWPILSYLQILEGGEIPHRDERMTGVALAILLAWMTVKFVERPLRFGTTAVRLKIAVLSGLMVCVALTGVVISRTDFSQTLTLANRPIEREGVENMLGTSGKWYWGKDGWMFLGEAHDQSVSKLKLSKTPDPEKIAEHVALYSALAQAGQSVDVPIVLLIGPNKSTIYPEFLPDDITPAPKRYVTAFTERLQAIPNLDVIDPSSELLQTKNGADLLFYRTDTHWNARGSYNTFVIMAKRLGLPVPQVSFKAAPPYPGDLVTISKLPQVPLSPGDNWKIEWADTPDIEIKPLKNQPETSFGRADIAINKAPLSEKTVWVIGDSYTNALAPYFDATFAQTHYLGHMHKKLPTLPQELLEAETKPDLIVVVRVERAF